MSMSSLFHFIPGRGLVPPEMRARVDAIARRHGVDFENPRLPDGYRYWFSARNRGEPFNRQTAQAVLADLRAAGIELP